MAFPVLVDALVISMEFKLTKEEKNAISTLKRLAKKWPPNLWLFSANGSLLVMRYNEHGEQAMLPNYCVDQEYIVDDIQGIPNDGGDF